MSGRWLGWTFLLFLFFLDSPSDPFFERRPQVNVLASLPLLAVDLCNEDVSLVVVVVVVVAVVVLLPV